LSVSPSSMSPYNFVFETEIPDACVGMSHPLKFPMHVSGCPIL
jgi:hypothetical protein